MAGHNTHKILDQYSNAALLAMAKARGVSVKGGKAAILAVMRPLMTDKASTKRAYESLPASTKVLLALLRDLGGETTILELTVTAKSIGMGDVDEHLTTLMRHALVLFHGNGYNKYELWNPHTRSYGRDPDTSTTIFAIPEALELATLKVELPPPDQKLELFTGMPAQVADQSPSILLHALYLVVRQGEIRKLPFTKQGKLSKPALKALAKEIGGDEKWAFFLCALARKAGLLVFHQGELVANREASAFFTKSPHEQVHLLTNAWLVLPNWSELNRIPEIETETDEVPERAAHSYYYGDIDVPTAERLGQARAFLIGLLRRAGIQSEWYSLASLQALAKAQDIGFLVPRRDSRSYDKDHYTGMWRAGETRWKGYLDKIADWDVVEGGYIREVLRGPLQWLGLVQIGGDAKGKAVAFRPTPSALAILGLTPGTPTSAPAAEERKALVVQANFEIVAYTDPEFLQVLFQLEQFAERVSYERVAHYKLTRDSVYRGLQGGLNASQMREFLAANSRNELPQNIAYSLDDWGKVHDRVHVYRATTLLEADTEAELDEALRRIAPCPIVRLSPLWALVPSDQADGVKRMLAVLDGTITLDYSVPVKRAFEIDDALCIEAPRENLDMWLRARLEQFSDKLTEDAASVRYGLTRDAFQRAASLGLKPEDILAFLRDLGPDPLPADVDLTLRGWGGLIEPVALSGTVALVSQYGLISTLAGVEELRQLLWLDINETVALIRQEDVAVLGAALERRGIAIGATPESRLAPPPQRRKPVQHRSNAPSHRRIISKAEIQAVAHKKKLNQAKLPLTAELNVYPRAAMVKLIVSAMEKNFCVIIDYDGKNRRVIRTIEPLDMYKENGAHYVEAMDRLTNEMRQFRIDRIRALGLTNEKFDPNVY